MNPSVRIMMATYNGENYLAEQIESIIGQTYTNWSMIIQDDQSTDSTWDILEQYASEDKRISIRKSPEKNHGAFYNFHSIANQDKTSGIKFDYYMFSDQDDIWDKDKIERLIEYIKQYDESKPVLVYADMRVIDQNGMKSFSSVREASGLHYKNKYSLFFSHIIHGCNLIMNRRNFESVPIIDINEKIVKILSHDNLNAKYAGILGNVFAYPGITMSYRRHGENVTADQCGYSIKRIIKRIATFDKLGRDHAIAYNQSLYTIKLMKYDSRFDQELLNEIEMAIRKGGLTSLHFVRKYKVDWGNTAKNISHKLILFFGLHKKHLVM